MTNWSWLNESCYLSSVGYYYSSQNTSLATSLDDVWGSHFRAPNLNFSRVFVVFPQLTYCGKYADNNETRLTGRQCYSWCVSVMNSLALDARTTLVQVRANIKWLRKPLTFRSTYLTFRIVGEVACSYSAFNRRPKITSIKGLKFAKSNETDHSLIESHFISLTLCKIK